jgi:hypothetical protein
VPTIGLEASLAPAGGASSDAGNTSQKQRVFFVRMNNSTRELPDDELDIYLADRWQNTGAK